MRKVPTASTGGETFSFEYIYLFALTSAIVCPVFSPNEDIRRACSYYREQRWLNWKRKINACNQPRPLRSSLGVHRGCRKRDSRRTDWHESMLPLFLLSLPLGSVSQWPESTGAMLCRELFSDFKEHCTCRQDSLSNGTRINCDGRSFFGTFVVLPYRQNIIQYSQSHAGLQDLESQLFTASDIPLQILDFSSNLLRRITDKVFDGIEDTLEHLELSHNLLGDQLTPVFGSKEFNRLNNLRYLGLSDNLIKAVGDNTFRGLVALKQLDLS
ncbi:SLIT and NTRK-like protein 2, partial [Varroa jacobsoni]|uniref:SLIT and NTRK-like protein 2 n=1 Tax=Varroa jacobsoni TaxID=62625 RepID=UPI000BF4B7BD